MTCKEHGQDILLYLFDELTENEKIKIEDHLNQCPDCSRRLREERDLLRVVKSPAEVAASPDWEAVWQRVKGRMDRRQSPQWLTLPAFKWGFTAAAAVFVLLLGIFIGRQSSVSPGETQWQESRYGAEGNRILVAGYLEEVKPFMVDYANFTPSGQGVNGGPVDKDIVASLLMQTRLLRRRLADAPDPQLTPLIEELEMILTDIGNILPGDRASVRTVQETIRQHGIPLKLTLYQQENRTQQL